MAKKGRMRQTLCIDDEKPKYYNASNDDNKIISDVIIIEDSLDSVIDVDLLYAQQETIFGDLRCSKCGQRFETLEEMTGHGKGCTELESICHICVKAIRGHSNFLNHIRSHALTEDDEETVEEDVSTEFKDDELSGQSICDNENNIIERGQEEKCPFCGEDVGIDGINFEKHLEVHAFPDPTGTHYPCMMCVKTFKTKSDLRRHMLRHTNIKPFKCPYCVKGFVTKNELQTHLRSHTGEHPYECDLCTATFTTSSSMKKHRNKHTGETRYVCYICSKKYFDSYALSRHIMMHTGERPYVCNICGRGFCQRGDMTVHMRIHTNERPFKCPICFVRFKQSSNRNSHMKRHALEQQQRVQFTN